MRLRLAAVRGLAPGFTLFLVLFIAGTVSLLRLAAEPDPDTVRILAHFRPKIFLTLLRIAIVHLWTGLVLGAGCGLLMGFLYPSLVRRRVAFSLATLGLLLAVFLYFTARLLIRQPTFFDQFLMAHGGLGQELLLLLTDRVGLGAWNLAYALLVAAVLLPSRSARSLVPVRRPWRRRQRVAVLVLATVLGTALLSSVWSPPQPEPTQKPSVVLLCVDSLRPDHMSGQGYHRLTTPNLDALAARGLTFEQAYVPVGRTLPSWTSLLTSTLPHGHGIRHMFPESGRRRLPYPTLPEVLRAHGYHSAVVSDFAGEMFDLLDLGFDRVDTPPASHVNVLVERQMLLHYPLVFPFVNHRLGKKLLPVISYLTINSDPEALAYRAIRRMRELADRGPFLLTVFFSTSHAPYASPYPYYGRFTDPAYRGPHRYAYGIRDPRQLAEGDPPLSLADREQITALYDGAIAAVDAAIGTLLQTLEEWEFLDNTLFLVFADHGEHLFEAGNSLDHGKWFRGGDHANWIPLILCDPQGKLDRGKVPGLVRNLEVMPTLLSRLDIPAPATCEGVDLGPALEGAAPFPELALLAETGIWLQAPNTFAGEPDALSYPHINEIIVPDENDHSLRVAPAYDALVVEAKHRMLRRGRYKLVYEPTLAGVRHRLYDVGEDPLNRHDLGPQSAAWQPLLSELYEQLRRDPCRRLDDRGHLMLDFPELQR